MVIEIVSNREGGDDTDKLAVYAQLGIRYYAIYDPHQFLSGDSLRVFRLQVRSYERMSEPIWFPEIGLGLHLQDGWYEDMDGTWLRWVDGEGAAIPTGKERAEAEHGAADAERQRAEAERQRAEAERQRADRLAEQLRQLGVQPQS